MKKCTALLIAAAMLLALWGCGKEATPTDESPEFLVGFGRADITPTDTGLPLGGYGQTDSRLHTNVLDPLYVSAVAVTGTNGETILLMSVDLINSSRHQAIRQQISQELDVPYENILFSATHTHSAPDQSNSKCAAYVTTMQLQAVEAAKQALEDRAPATVSIGRTETDGVNFIRHYIMNDGTYAGANFGDFSSGIKGHAEENDPQVQLIKFTRKDKKNIIMANYQGHPLVTSGLTVPDLSADVVGAARMRIEFQTKDHFIFFLGASGNVNMGTRLPNPANPEDYNYFGEQLASVIVTALDTMTPVETGEVHTLQQTCMGQVNREMEDRLGDALRVRDYYNATDRDTGNKMARELGFSSVYHASGIVSRSGIPEDELPIDLSVFSFGDICFTAAPYEMFAAHGMQIKEESPYTMTFVATCANGAMGYLPTEFAFEFGCYESHTSRFTADTGTKCAETFLSMLDTMKTGN